MNITLRQATTTDIPLIFALIKELAAYEKLLHEVVATEAILHENLFGAKPYAEVVIVSDNQTPIGFAIFYHNFSTFLGKPGIYLEDLYVRPEARGKGAGKQLLIYLAQLAQARNCGRLEWAVLDWNQPAIDFYESLGAKPKSEWTVYQVTGDALTKLAQR